MDDTKENKETQNDSSNNIQATSLLDYANQYMANMKISNAPKPSINSILNIKPKNFNFQTPKAPIKLENLMPKLNINCDNKTQLTNNEDIKENLTNNVDYDDDIDLSIAIIKKPVEKVIIVEEVDTEDFVLPPVPEDDFPVLPEALKKADMLPCLLYDSALKVGVTDHRPYKLCSTLGKVLCRQFRKRRIPYVELKYHGSFDNVKVFKFDVPSPDEKILAKLLRK